VLAWSSKLERKEDKGKQALASLLSADKRQEALLIAEKRQTVVKRQPGRNEASDTESHAYRPQGKQEPANADKGKQALASLLSADKRQEALLIAEKRQAVVKRQPVLAQSPSGLKASHQPRAFQLPSTSLESAASTSDIARRSSERPAPVSSSPCAKYADQLIAKATGKLPLPTMARVDEDQSADANPQEPLSASAIFPSQARRAGPAGAGGDGRGGERERASSAVARGTPLERPALNRPVSYSASTSSPCAKMADQLVARATGKVPSPTGCRVKIDAPPPLTVPAHTQAYAQAHAAYPGRKVPLPANHPSLRNVLEVSGAACCRHASALRRTVHTYTGARARTHTHTHTQIHTDTRIRIHANTNTCIHIRTHARASTQ
jgi:hypothetical protein